MAWVAQAAATAHLQVRIFALDWAAPFAASARPSAAGELVVENERGRETLAFTPVERVSIIGIELFNLDVVVGYRLRGGTRGGELSARMDQNEISSRACAKERLSVYGGFRSWRRLLLDGIAK